MPRKHPFPERETAIARRLREVRAAAECPRNFLASTIGCEPEDLKRVELGRAFLKYGLAREIINFLNVNPIWLATGSGDMFGGLILPEPADIGHDYDQRFSIVFDACLSRLLCPETEAEIEAAAKLSDLSRYNAEYDLREDLVEMFDELPDDAFFSTLESVRRFVRDQIGEAPKDIWQNVLARRKRRQDSSKWPARSAHIPETEKNSSLTHVHGSVKRSDVKAQWPLLKKRLQAATAEPGLKSELAEFLNVKLASVSQWLTDSANAREPGAETALKMLYWLEHPAER